MKLRGEKKILNTLPGAWKYWLLQTYVFWGYGLAENERRRKETKKR